MKSKIERERDRYRIYSEWISFLNCHLSFAEIGYLLNIAYESKIAFINSSIIKSIKGHEEEMKIKYEKSLEAYKKVLDNFTKLFKELNIDDSLGVSVLNAYLLWNGYFSFYKKHCFSNNKILTIPGLLAFDAINGNGTCITFANLLSDCLNNSEIKAASIACGTPMKLKMNYIPSISREIKSSTLRDTLSTITDVALYPFVKGMNHCITLISDDDKFYAFDPTNLLVLNIDNELNANGINGQGTFRLSPCKSLLTQPSADPNEIYATMFDKKRVEAYNRDSVIRIVETVLNIINKHKQILEDFYDDNHGYYETIHEEMKRYGNGVKK